MSAVRTVDDVAPRWDAAGSRAVHVLQEAADATELRQEHWRIPPKTSTSGSIAGRVATLFVVAGSGTLRRGGQTHPLRPGIAAYIAVDEAFEIEAGEDGLDVVTVSSPDAAEISTGSRHTTIDLAEQEARDAVSDRKFRVLFDPDTGCAAMTQFIGYIPPIRTPLHYHDYSEMVYVVDGHGQVEIDGAQYTIGPGSTFYLPAGCHHLVENLGTGYLRLLGVLRPASSPDVAHPVLTSP
ncbi:cupin domain-containing protein [Phytoactinopolyspora limicola]|uniref:cupin domain-containing protein n=1 Tax=Phytoactinopolyspora limicola TaxID=2715536 RepID=UPI00140B247A|nr:cupin domain-containing protein [Phytoactinopolyspora limicola]